MLCSSVACDGVKTVSPESRGTNLKEQELRRKVGKEVHVYYEDGVHEDATEGGPEDEEPAAVGVGPRAGEESVDHRRDGLQDAVVPLRCGSANVQCKMAKMLNE